MPFLLPLLASLAIGTYTPEPQTTLASWELSGPVKQVTVKVEYFIDNHENPVNKELLDHYLGFDARGRLVGEASFWNDGDKTDGLFWGLAYDGQDRVTARITLNPDKTVAAQTVYKYVDPGLTYAQYHKGSDNPLSSFEWKTSYAERDGRVEVVKSYSDPSQAEEAEVYTVDEDGHVLTDTPATMGEYDGIFAFTYRDGLMTHMTRTGLKNYKTDDVAKKYDDHRLLIDLKKINYPTKSAEHYVYTYKFDDHGNWIEQDEFAVDDKGEQTASKTTWRAIVYYG